MLLSLSMAQFMVVLDFTIVNVALPSIQRDLASALLTATPAGSPDHGLSPQGAVPRRRGCGGPAGARPDGVMPVRLCGARLTIFFCPNGSWFPGPYMYKPPLTG